MVHALAVEIELSTVEWKPFLPSVETLYFGGGTPSLLNNLDLTLLVSQLKTSYQVDESAECTLETNPDDITLQQLSAWKSAGFNRLSIGIQSFSQEHLTWMNRVHDATQARESIMAARDAGFNNFSIDLIYGIPGLSDEEWIQTVEEALQYAPPHVACYALTVEPGTALQKMIMLTKKEDVDQEVQSRQFLLLMQKMREAGYEHYEISNFALPGYRSRHNSSYWSGSSYLGIGPSAHSYNGNIRKWNVSNNAKYLDAINAGRIPAEAEILRASQRLNEYIMTSLRTIDGLSLDRVFPFLIASEKKSFSQRIEKFKENGWLYEREERLILKDAGKLFADGIAADLFVNDSGILADLQ